MINEITDGFEKNPSRNGTSPIPCEPNSTPLPIFAREPYRTMIQNKQYHECILFHRDRLNAIRRKLGGQDVSYTEIRKQLQRFLKNYS